MTAKMREDRETRTTTSTPLNTMDELAYNELKTENKKLKKRVEEAEGETTIVKGIGINSPEMRGLQTENKNLKNLLGDANDKITVLQLQSESPLKEKKDWKVTLSYNIRHDDTYLIQNETKEGAIYIAENQNTSPKHDCICIKENKSDIEDEETTIKEVVFDTEKKDWIDKEKK